jgi:hypothetical protein
MMATVIEKSMKKIFNNASKTIGNFIMKIKKKQ